MIVSDPNNGDLVAGAKQAIEDANKANFLPGDKIIVKEIEVKSESILQTGN